MKPLMHLSRRLFTVAPLALVFLVAPAARAVVPTVAHYTFTGNSLASSDTDPNSTAANFVAGAGFSGKTTFVTVFGSNGFAVTSDNVPSSEAAAISGSDYLSFTLFPNNGFTGAYSNLFFNIVATDNTNAVDINVEVRWSVDNFASALTTDTLSLNPGTQSEGGAGGALPSVPAHSGPVEFRFYIFNNPNNPNSTFCTEGIANVTLSSNETQCVPPPMNLVGWWPGDGNTIDIQGNNNGTLRNGAGFGVGEVGQAFSFNGSSQDVSIGDPASLKLTTGMTIDAWVYPTSTPGGLVGVLTKWHQDFSLDSMADSYALFLNGSQVSAYIHLSDGNEANVAGGSVPVNTWTHVAATYDAATGVFTAYVNGVSVSSATISALNIFATDAPVDLGSEADDGSGRYFPGLIDEVEVFNRALTAGEVAAIYNAGAAGKCKSVLLYVSNDNNTIEKFDANGNDLGSFASSGLNLPQGLAFDVSGNLYAANLGSSGIEKFDGNGNDLGAFASSGLDRPAGLAFDASGHLYAANSNPSTNTIEKFSANGADQGAFAHSGLSEPVGLAFDVNGNLYAGNAGSRYHRKIQFRRNRSYFR